MSGGGRRRGGSREIAGFVRWQVVAGDFWARPGGLCRTCAGAGKALSRGRAEGERINPTQPVLNAIEQLAM